MRTHSAKMVIRILAFMVIFAMLASLLPAIPQEAKAATTPQNPRSDGSTVTWDCVWFGNYPQSSDGNGRYKVEPIKWRVLSVDGNDAFLLADQNLDCKNYNEDYRNITWELCTLRSWLNGYDDSRNANNIDYSTNSFISKAFSQKEQQAIIETTETITNTKNKIFLLHWDEVQKMEYGFPAHGKSSNTRKATNTDYAVKQGAFTYSGYGNWCLRTPASWTTAYVAYVESGGHLVNNFGYPVHGYKGYIPTRPALHLDLSSNCWSYAGTVSSDGTVEEKEPSSNDVNNSIIERVSEYTTDEIFKELDAIKNGNYSHEVKWGKLYDLFIRYGMADAKNLIDYLGGTSDKRFAYSFLTNNDIYCASNFQYKLDQDPKMRAALIGSALLLGGEINAWVDVTTLATSNYPGVSKYKEMLYDFMNATSESIEVQSSIKMVSDLSKNVTDAAKLRADNLIDKLNACENIEEVENTIKSNEASGVFAELGETNKDGKTVLSYKLDESSGFGKFAKATGTATKTVSIVDMGIRDVLDLLSFDSKLKVYDQYKDFLEDILSTKEYLPVQLRLAASQILDELDEGYFSKVKGIAMGILQRAKFNDAAREDILGAAKAKSFSAWLTTVNVTSFFINKVASVGENIKAEAHVEGYSYLARAFTKQLEASKQAFIKNKTEANAWDFYYNYNILYRLRYMGELAYLKMTNVEGAIKLLSDFGYSEKEAVVNETLTQMEKSCKFTFDPATSMPKSCQFATKTAISCPVNVDVYTPEGELIASLEDGKESNFANRHGKFAVVYDAYSGDYVKVIGLYDDRNYAFKIAGIDDGLVNLELAQSDGNTKATYAFSNVPISKEALILTSIKQLTQEKTYDMDGDGDGIADSKGQVYEKPDTHVAVSGIALKPGTLELKKGEHATLQIETTPGNASSQEVSWVSTNPGIAMVSDGKVTAVAEGTATVHCRSLDNPDLMESCKVTVVSNASNSSEAGGGGGAAPSTDSSDPPANSGGQTTENATDSGNPSGTIKPGQSGSQQVNVGDIIADDASGGSYRVTNVDDDNGTVSFQGLNDKNAKRVVIPDTIKKAGKTYKVTAIADNAFRNNKKLKKVKISNNIITIGKNAFRNCRNLKTVKMGKNVAIMKRSTFRDCRNLKTIVIPAKTKKIGAYAFANCKKTKKLIVKSKKLTPKNVGRKAFKGIPAKATADVPNKKIRAYKKLLWAKGLDKKVKIK